MSKYKTDLATAVKELEANVKEFVELVREQRQREEREEMVSGDKSYNREATRLFESAFSPFMPRRK